MVNVLSLCCSVLFLSNLAFAASGAPHVISNKRGGHARIINSIQRRAAADRALEDRSDFIAAEPRKRSTGRCSSKTTTSTTVAPTTTSHAATTTSAIGNPGGNPTTTTSSTHATHTTHSTTTEVVKHTSSTKHTTTKKAAVESTTTKEATPTTSVSSGGGSGTTYSGQGTYYGTGLGACGITNKDTDLIAAVSHLLFDSWPGATANPNDNPICGRYATAHYQGKSVTVKITDRCVGCEIHDLDFSPTAFSDLADQSLGRIDITWQWD